MGEFAAGRLGVLVATTVIEVGVDIPKASLMIVENAERLGLAQLHQLRGRVGRGADKSHCVLMYRSPLGEMARERLNTMRNTNDRFESPARTWSYAAPVKSSVSGRRAHCSSAWPTWCATGRWPSRPSGLPTKCFVQTAPRWSS